MNVGNATLCVMVGVVSNWGGYRIQQYVELKNVCVQKSPKTFELITS